MTATLSDGRLAVAVCRGCGVRTTLERVKIRGIHEWMPPIRWREEWGPGGTRRFLCEVCPVEGSRGKKRKKRTPPSVLAGAPSLSVDNFFRSE
jgi:hypothetical protein